ncbi:hypothetical protein AXF42_Ash013550 [Apostasia shenzhenica]|uniref:Uncharacterized protein n=1 Tax=Apostasia shenzhenica TaxID=1088818 RepID=A0A2I0AP94_9ASPA|nr:hypothetical protein AXF42_Ash013550 [Apostasia shenzhenica]
MDLPGSSAIIWRLCAVRDHGGDLPTAGVRAPRIRTQRRPRRLVGDSPSLPALVPDPHGASHRWALALLTVGQGDGAAAVHSSPVLRLQCLLLLPLLRLRAMLADPGVFLS